MSARLDNPTGNWAIRFPGMHNEAFVAEVAKELDEMLMWEAIMCEQEQRELAELYHNRPPLKCVDGIGPQILAITPTAFIHYKAIEQLDFSNPRDIKYLINRHPHMAVRKAPQTVKTQFGYQAKAESGKQKAETGIVTQERNVRETVKFSNN